MLIKGQIAMHPPDSQLKPKAYNDSFRRKLPGLTRTLNLDSNSLSDEYSASPKRSRVRYNHESTKSLTKDASWVRLEDLKDRSFDPEHTSDSKPSMMGRKPSINNIRSPSINQVLADSQVKLT